MNIIAHIHNDLDTKFGVARQSGLTPHLQSRVIFTPPFRNSQALRGLEGFSYIWLLWDFSEAHAEGWRPTVRPPRLGGNKRVGVFATRSPFRPNHIGLSCVRLVEIQESVHDGPVLVVDGADMMNGTPILDIKPYLPYTDSHPEATAGFAEQALLVPSMEVELSLEVQKLYTPLQLKALTEIMQGDPRPQYHDDSSRVYHIIYGGQELSFLVKDRKIVVFCQNGI